MPAQCQPLTRLPDEDGSEQQPYHVSVTIYHVRDIADMRCLGRGNYDLSSIRRGSVWLERIHCHDGPARGVDVYVDVTRVAMEGDQCVRRRSHVSRKPDVANSRAGTPEGGNA